jgi:hypothetical protein
VKRDLDIGRQAETLVVQIIEYHGGEAQLNDDKKSRSLYDIRAKHFKQNFTIEVKNDVYALKSGNIAIEIFNPKSNKPSGLMVTQATLWVHVLGDEVWLTSTSKLKNFLNTNKPHRIIDVGGDNNSTMYLYKKDIIIPSIFVRIDNVSKPLFKRVLCKLL